MNSEKYLEKGAICNVEAQYQSYLDKMMLQEEQMPEVQKVEMRRTFFGAWGQLLLLLRDEVSMLEDEQAFDVLEGMTNQVANFWLAENTKQN